MSLSGGSQKRANTSSVRRFEGCEYASGRSRHSGCRRARRGHSVQHGATAAGWPGRGCTGRHTGWAGAADCRGRRRTRRPRHWSGTRRSRSRCAAPSPGRPSTKRRRRPGGGRWVRRRAVWQRQHRAHCCTRRTSTRSGRGRGCR